MNLLFYKKLFTIFFTCLFLLFCADKRLKYKKLIIMRNCFVPGCDQQMKNKTKRAMFLVPKNEEMFQKWIEVLPKVRTLKSHDKVCHLHFREKDIVSTYDHHINGVLYQLERGRPRLSLEAVPTENLPTTEELKLILKPSKRMIKKTLKKKSSPSPPPVLQESVTELNVQLLEEDGQDMTVSHEDFSKNHAVQSTTIADAVITDEQEIPQIDNIFSLFYDNINQVELPNTLWAVHRCPKRTAIFYSYMDTEHMRCTKVIRIACDGSLKVFVVNRLLYELSILDGIELLELSQILSQIDSIEIDEVQSESAEEVISENPPYELMYAHDQSDTNSE